MRDVLDWIDYDLKVRHSYAHVVADITKRAGTAINEIEGEKKWDTMMNRESVIERT